MSESSDSVLLAELRVRDNDSTLKHVYLTDMRHTDAEMRGLLEALVDHPDVVSRLFINKNRLTDVSGLLLARYVARSSTLCELDLSGNDFRAATYLALAQALQKNTSLERLYTSEWQGVRYGRCTTMRAKGCRCMCLAYRRLHNKDQSACTCGHPVIAHSPIESVAADRVAALSPASPLPTLLLSAFADPSTARSPPSAQQRSTSSPPPPTTTTRTTITRTTSSLTTSKPITTLAQQPAMARRSASPSSDAAVDKKVLLSIASQAVVLDMRRAVGQFKLAYAGSEKARGQLNETITRVGTRLVELVHLARLFGEGAPSLLPAPAEPPDAAPSRKRPGPEHDDAHGATKTPRTS